MLLGDFDEMENCATNLCWRAEELCHQTASGMQTHVSVGGELENSAVCFCQEMGSHAARCRRGWEFSCVDVFVRWDAAWHARCSLGFG